MEESQDVVKAIISKLVNRAFKLIHEHNIEREAIQMTAETVVEALKQTIEVVWILSLI